MFYLECSDVSCGTCVALPEYKAENQSEEGMFAAFMRLMVIRLLSFIRLLFMFLHQHAQCDKTADVFALVCLHL